MVLLFSTYLTLEILRNLLSQKQNFQSKIDMPRIVHIFKNSSTVSLIFFCNTNPEFPLHVIHRSIHNLYPFWYFFTMQYLMDIQFYTCNSGGNLYEKVHAKRKLLQMRLMHFVIDSAPCYLFIEHYIFYFLQFSDKLINFSSLDFNYITFIYNRNLLAAVTYVNFHENCKVLH